MKKISLIALGLVLLSGSAMAATTAGNGEATAKIVQAVTATETQKLNFGTMLGNASTVEVTDAGARSATPDSVLVTDGNTPKQGIIDLTGPNNQPITITLPDSATVTKQGSSETMTVNQFSSPQSGQKTLDGTGKLTINIGAKLGVTEGQATGDYKGPYTITITY